MRLRLSGPWIVINRPPCDEDFDSASRRFDASIYSPTDICILNSCNS